MAPDDPSDAQGNGAQQPRRVPRPVDPGAAGQGDIGGAGPEQSPVKRDGTDKGRNEGRPTGQRGTGQSRARRRGPAGGGTGGRATGPRGGTQRGTGPGAPRPGTPQHDEERQRHAQRRLWFTVGYIVVALLLLYLFQQFILGPITSPSTALDYSTFKKDVAAEQIDTAVIGTSQITGTMKSTDPKVSTPVAYKVNAQLTADPQLVQELQAAKVDYSFAAPASPIGGILLYLLPFLLIGVLFYYIYRRAARAAGAGMEPEASSGWAAAKPPR